MYVQVVKSEHGRDAIELPLESDDTLDMATVTSQFPGAIGLKYKAESGAWRALKVKDSVISNPAGTWSESIKYVVTYNQDNKRKADEDESRQAKRSALLNTPQDLVVLNMPYDITEDDMRAYFDKYGELSFIQMKKKPSGESRGFGFIRYVELEDQKECLADSHKMGDRTLEVKIPQSKAAGFDDVIDSSGGQRLSRRIHVSNITTRIGRRDIEDYFSQFGPITDVFIPKETETRKNPMYAFLTYDDEKDARALIESSKPHIIHGDTLNVAFASPIVKDGNKSKSPHGYFDDMMTQYMNRAMDGYFGSGDRPNSKTEATGMLVAVMKRWIDRNTGSVYDDRMRGYGSASGGYGTSGGGYAGGSFGDQYGTGSAKYKW